MDDDPTPGADGDHADMSGDPAVSAHGEGTATKASPPVWLMGFTTASYGMIGGVMLITTPQLLAAMGTPEPHIALVTGLGLFPGSFAFLLSPVLDIRFKRRTYACLFSGLSALFMLAALLSLRNIAVLGAMLFASNLCATLFLGAQNGWIGSLVSDAQKSRLGAWCTMGNIGGGGVIAMAAIPLLRALPFTLGAVALSLLIVAPILPFAWMPAPPPDRRLRSESWRAVIRDVAVLVRRPSVLRLVAVFASPTAAFALSYTLGGLGAQFHAGERFVGLIGGAGVLVGGVVGSLLVPPLAARIPPRSLYLLIGSVGALFSLCLIIAPRTPATFAVAMLGENIFQAAAFATSFAIGFRSLGENNPLAATQMSLLTAATSFPIAYMQVLDGRAYGFGGLTASYLSDGLLSLLACAIFFALLRRWREPVGSASGGAVQA